MERITCESCGAEVFEASSVAETRPDGVHRFCSVRCASIGGVAERLTPAALAKRIVVAIDGSGPSLRALEIAAGIATASGGTITLVHAIDVRGVRALKTLESAPDFLGRLALEVEQALREDAEAQLLPARGFLERVGVASTERLEVGAALDIITEEAADADLVVLGSRGMGAVSGAVLGSLSHRVIGAVRCPVLVVH